MKRIGEIIGKGLSKYNLTTTAFSLTVIYRTRNHLVNMFGEKVLKNIDIEKYQDNTVFIKCSSASWAQEIQLVKNEIIESLINDFPEKKYFNLKIFH